MNLKLVLIYFIVGLAGILLGAYLGLQSISNPPTISSTVILTGKETVIEGAIFPNLPPYMPVGKLHYQLFWQDRSFRVPSGCYNHVSVGDRISVVIQWDGDLMIYPSCP